MFRSPMKTTVLSLLSLSLVVTGCGGAEELEQEQAPEQQAAHADHEQEQDIGTTESALETSLTVFTANIEQRQHSPELREKIANIRPGIVVVSEANEACAALRDIARDLNYTVVQKRTADGHCGKVSSTAILVKNTRKIEDVSFMWMNESWTGPHGAHQPPRVYPVVRVSGSGHVWNVIGVHFPWVRFSGDCSFESGQNLVAWKESWERVSNNINNRTIRTVAAGDWNATGCQLSPRVDNMSGDVNLIVANSKVDHAIVKKTSRHDFQRYDPPYGHGWIKYNIWSPE